jgi:hypothetical protein
VLKPLETGIELMLNINPMKKGTIIIKGIKWNVFGLDCKHMLDFPDDNKKNVINV